MNRAGIIAHIMARALDNEIMLGPGEMDKFLRRVYAQDSNPLVIEMAQHMNSPEVLAIVAEFAKRHEAPPLPVLKVPEEPWVDPAEVRRDARLARRGRSVADILRGA